MTRPWILLVLLAGLAGCATTPVPVSNADIVPKSRLETGYAQFKAQTPGFIKVTFVRDAGFNGAGRSVVLAIDGTNIAQIRTSESVVIYLAPGSHIFAVAPTPQAGDALVERSFIIGTEDPRFFRISLGSGGFVVQPSTKLQ
ncbi:hypothetical protein UU9_13226 [Rhodanobacter fulvus Jip2]|uniref:Lipoprotein n=1 Tax=Rhodanobacter fulvus Jip2 TaxID=1163408 RepID=I4VM12_9GAMM|nr:hypothetical protein UU9_13226 [Rhodanobacter fulvus Jip2]